MIKKLLESHHLNEEVREKLEHNMALAEQGQSGAQCALGDFFSMEIMKIIEDDLIEYAQKAVEWYRKAAEQGYSSAQYKLGCFYEIGKGVQQDYQEAIKWFRKAADQGIASAQYKLSIYYEIGRGVQQDYIESVKWLRKAAEQNNSLALCKLGYYYIIGRGVQQDRTESVKWYRKAAEMGNVKAQYELALLYSTGLGVTANYQKAEFWFRKAAEQGYVESTKTLEINKEWDNEETIFANILHFLDNVLCASDSINPHCYTYEPGIPPSNLCWLNRNMAGDVSDRSDVYSSIFAPAEVKRKSHMLIQVYLHLFEETDKVKALAQESQKEAERRDYVPLQCKLKKGDTVDVHLSIYGETLLMKKKKSVIWQGSFTKCSFNYFVPKDIDIDELSCKSMLIVNGAPIGEMMFVVKVVDNPRLLHPEIVARKFRKIYISYSHLDEEKVKFLAEGFKLMDVDYFFDRHYLKAGDVFPQEIQNYINSADLFILCWSENASKSEYVEKERTQALKRAFPQVKPQQAAKLSLYPMSIEPKAALPRDMRDNYHFGEL